MIILTLRMYEINLFLKVENELYYLHVMLKITNKNYF